MEYAQLIQAAASIAGGMAAAHYDKFSGFGSNPNNGHC